MKRIHWMVLTVTHLLCSASTVVGTFLRDASTGQQTNDDTRIPKKTSDGENEEALVDADQLLTIELYQSDFEEGTFRIQQAGEYILQEDIEFGPQVANDYWPPFSLWYKFPPSKYYLGFFAAITVESDDVVIDLNGFTIRQSLEFYLLQRFFNVIELNDRIFVQNEGVSSLNYQSTDKPAGGPQSAGAIVTPRNVMIKNGSIGRSSHSGIHGNIIEGLVVDNVIVSDFEVSGIHCNGCKDVSITSSVIGPSARNVPALATFANSRFLEFYTHQLIPFGFQSEPDSEALLDLFSESISFADRPDESYTLQQVFDRNKRAQMLFRGYFLGTNSDHEDLSEDDASLLEEARQVFENPTGLTDGSVQYGILLNRRGLPPQDDNFNGAGVETADVVISNVTIHGLHANPVEVPSLMTEEGSHMQGPFRDLIRIWDITTDSMRTLLSSYYKGNFLSDVYFAMWQLSNTFYRLRVFDSDCGNFGSNASMPLNMNGFPSNFEPTCADLGMTSDPSLTGRDVTLLQKRYFGGLQVSQSFYDWATTTKTGLDTLLASPSRADLLRSGGHHMLVCNQDTMFHTNQGVIGLKIVEAARVMITNVEIMDLLNTADDQLRVCNTKWQLQPSGEDVRATTAAINAPQGAMVRGVEVVRSDEIDFSDVTINQLISHEGGAMGFDIIGDRNDRTDHDDDTGISFELVSITDLQGPKGGVPFKSMATPVTMPSGIIAGVPEETDSSLGNPRTVLNYAITNTRVKAVDVTKAAALLAKVLGVEEQLLVDVAPATVALLQSQMLFGGKPVIKDMLATTTFDTHEKILAFRRRVFAYFEQQFGIRFKDNVHDISIWEIFKPVFALDRDGKLTDSFVLFVKQKPEIRYHASTLCVAGGDNGEQICSEATVSPVHDFIFSFIPGPSGYTLYGAFGGDQGKYAPLMNQILAGVYSFERIVLPGVNEGTNLQVEYFGECPISQEVTFHSTTAGYINCALDSAQFGKGRTTGTIVSELSDDGTEYIVNAYITMMFDDRVLNPVASDKKTTILDKYIPGVTLPKWRFAFVADGLFPTLLSAVDAVPYGHAHHYTNEAALAFFKLRTSLQTDDDIRDLRRQFLVRLRDDFGIAIDVDVYDDIPLDGVIDLGGGNKIVAYVVNEAAKQRVMTKRGHNGDEVVPLPRASRLHEGGFRFRVGRAGIMSSDGRLPFGTVFLQGKYVLEDSTAEDLEIDFWMDIPIIFNPWSSGVICQHLFHPVLGEGTMTAITTEPATQSDGIKINLRGSLLFGEP